MATKARRSGNEWGAVRLREIEAIAREAREQAARNLEEFGLTLDNDTDMRYVAAILVEASVEPESNLNLNGDRLAGLLRYHAQQPQILFERYDPLVRQRFSIAHEVGHIYLHVQSGYERNYGCNQGSVDPADERPSLHLSGGEDREAVSAPSALNMETEADVFAAAFLLPAETLLADVAYFGRCDAFLAERYGVSEPTLRRRLRTLERFDR